MDREQARFILRSFRPDGADATDPDFEEALAVAAADPELGDWLTGERAQDAVHAAALDDLAIPPALRAGILERLEVDLRQEKPETGGAPPGEPEPVEVESPGIGVVVKAAPAPERRKQTLKVLKVETRKEPEEPGLAEVGERNEERGKRGPLGWWKTTMVAAALVLGAFAAFELTSTSGRALSAPDAGISLSKLEHRAIKEVAHPVKFPLRSAHLPDHQAWMRRNHAPAFDLSEIPKGISGGRAVGCRFFMMGQTKISLVSLDTEGQSVHLAVLRSEDLKPEDLQKLENGSSECWQCPATKVSVAAWQGSEQVYLLLGKMGEEDLQGLLGSSS